MKKILIFTFSALVLIAAEPAVAETINVSGKSNIFFSDLSSPIACPSGYNEGDYYGDLTDPGVIPAFVDITSLGDTISITASGWWSHTPTPNSGPDGYDGYDQTDPQYLVFGISPILDGKLNALIGVFLTDDAPDTSSTPASLRAYISDMTHPLLQQGFLIGSSLDDITVPVGATRLFLGLNNGYEWTNNSGSMDVTVVPVPGAVLLGMLGLGVAGVKLRKYS